MSKVTIIDSCCGTGKTSYAIQTMNDNLDKRYIFITPFLDEVNRVIENCPCRYFHQPDVRKGKGSKTRHFNKLLSEGKNIASTHALFRNMNNETMDLLKENNYTLILDEVMNVIEPFDLTKNDMEDLLEKHIIIDEDEKVHWITEEYNGAFNKYYYPIVNGDVYYTRGTFMMWTFPIKVFKQFEEVYIMTYLFKGQMQRYYYDMNNIKYEYKSVIKNDDNTYELIDYKDINKGIYKDLINICDSDKLNQIGQDKPNYNPLSVGWFARQDKGDGLEVLKNNIYNYFYNICKSKSGNNGWTVFIKYRDKCKGKGYTKGFIPFNARATNEYRDRNCFVYAVNLYMNPMISGFFIDRGVNIDEDSWALAEMIQFIFRGCIRDLKPMDIYIPSERMRNLLIGWLSE